MKKSFYIFLVISIVCFSDCFGQSDFHEKHFEIDSSEFGVRKFKNNLSVDEIDSLKFYNKLIIARESFYGLQTLFYYKKHLVYIERTEPPRALQSETTGYYLSKSKIIKIVETNLNGYNFHVLDTSKLDSNLFKTKYYSSTLTNIPFDKNSMHIKNLEKGFKKNELLLTEIYLSKNEINNIIIQTDKKREKSELIEYSLKSMHSCGGSVTGFFNYKRELQMIKSSYNYPTGYIERIIYFNNNKPIFKSYKEFIPDDEKDLYYESFNSGEQKIKDNSKVKLTFPYLDFIESMNDCVNKMERDLIFEFKTKD